MSVATMMIRNIARRSLAQAPRASAVGSVRFATKFAPSHEYASVDGKIVTCGITDFAQAALGDIVFVDLPEVGDDVEKNEPFGSVESVKAASDVYAPVSGTVVEVNESLEDDPSLVNSFAESDAWFIKVEIEDESELDDLMTPEAYKEHCEKES